MSTHTTIEAVKEVGTVDKATCSLNGKEARINLGKKLYGFENVRACVSDCPFNRKMERAVLVINGEVVKCTKDGSLLRYGHEGEQMDLNNLCD